MKNDLKKYETKCQGGGVWYELYGIWLFGLLSIYDMIISVKDRPLKQLFFLNKENSKHSDYSINIIEP